MTYNLSNAYTNVILNADGYTKEIEEVIHDSAAVPYKICYESQNNNRFEMGTNWHEFDVLFVQKTGILNFEIYITMGYGWSATKQERLHPIYYVPEFNRKAAWKVKVNSPTWKEGDTATEKMVVIDIYDWNHGATVASNYPDPTHTNHIKSASDVLSVFVEIPEMLDSTVEATTEDTSSNGWDNPISYTAMIANEKNLPEGAYLGLVKVFDSRAPSTVPQTTDSLIHAPYMDSLEYYVIPEFATYQSFLAGVVNVGPGYDWGGDYGGEGSDVGYDVKVDDVDGSVYITGAFYGRVDFDPGVGEAWFQSNGEGDIFVLKLDRYGRYVWAKTVGGGLWDEGHALGIASSSVGDSIYVTGYFQGTNVDFDPGFGIDRHSSNGYGDVFLLELDSETGNYKSAKSWGGGIWDEGHGLAICPAWRGPIIYIVGYFQGPDVDFDPGPGEIIFSSKNDSCDSFLWCFDSAYGNLDVYTWGSDSWDAANDVINEYDSTLYITGGFTGTADLDPGSGVSEITSNGDKDLYVISFFTGAGYSWWERRIGSSGADEGLGIEYSYYLWNVYVTGYFEQSADFNETGGGDWHTSNGGRDILLCDWSYNGYYIWGRSCGGDGIWDEGHALAYDRTKDEIHVTGCFEGTVDFDPGVTEDYHTSNGGRDIFLNSYDRDGGSYVPESTLTWGGSGIWDEGHGMDTGSIYITGSFEYGMDFDPGPDEDWHSSNGDTDIFLIKVKPEGANETEPNDTCAQFNEIFDPPVNGLVRDTIDDVDFWGFRTGSYSIYVVMNLVNTSGQNIDLSFYNEDCTSEIASSHNPGGGDEYIGPQLLTSNSFYRI